MTPHTPGTRAGKIEISNVFSLFVLLFSLSFSLFVFLFCFIGSWFVFFNCIFMFSFYVYDKFVFYVFALDPRKYGKNLLLTRRFKLITFPSLS